LGDWDSTIGRSSAKIVCWNARRSSLLDRIVDEHYAAFVAARAAQDGLLPVCAGGVRGVLDV